MGKFFNWLKYKFTSVVPEDKYRVTGTVYAIGVMSNKIPVAEFDIVCPESCQHELLWREHGTKLTRSGYVDSKGKVRWGVTEHTREEIK